MAWVAKLGPGGQLRPFALFQVKKLNFFSLFFLTSDFVQYLEAVFFLSFFDCRFSLFLLCINFYCALDAESMQNAFTKCIYNTVLQ